MTTIDIDTIRRLCNRATGGNWTIRERKTLDRRIFAIISEGEDEMTYADIAEVPLEYGDDLNDWRNDAEFIAAARTLLPACADEIEKLRAENADMRQTLAGPLPSHDGPWKAYIVHEGWTVDDLSDLAPEDEVTVTIVRDTALPDDEGNMPGTYKASDVAYETSYVYVDGEGDESAAAPAVFARAKSMAAGLNAAEAKAEVAA